MRTALEMINILFVACEAKVRRKEQEEAKTNNYCIWNTLESGIGVQVLTFIGFFWKKKKVYVCPCVCVRASCVLTDIIFAPLLGGM